MHAMKPKVTIGLPIYNGERYVAVAIDSILGQSYENFELIISDNASTDRTEEICRGYAERNPRVRYYRQPMNLGAAANFNRSFELAEGSKYFKWAAHDDWIAPTYLQECVSQLENHPDAVVCQSLVEFVDPRGQPLQAFSPSIPNIDLPGRSDRFGAALKGLSVCAEIFGVIRTDVLATTALIGNHQGGDRTLLLELALCGRFLVVPQYLFFNRDHCERYSGRYTPQEEVAWYGAKQGSRIPCRTWVLYAACLRLLRDRVDNVVERRRCYFHVLQSMAGQRRWKKLLLEPVIVLHPRLFRAYAILRDPGRRSAVR